jgi:hypothetical protein
MIALLILAEGEKFMSSVTGFCVFYKTWKTAKSQKQWIVNSLKQATNY